MSNELRTACALRAEDLPERLAEIRAIGEEALLSVDPDGLLRFRSDLTTRDLLERLIAAESACCQFLGFDLREQGAELLLRITAPEGAEPLALDFVGLLAGARAA